MKCNEKSLRVLSKVKILNKYSGCFVTGMIIFEVSSKEFRMSVFNSQLFVMFCLFVFLAVNIAEMIQCLQFLW